MFDLKTKIIIGIGSALLLAAIVLICVVLSLFFKVSSVLKAAKECYPSKFQSKVIPSRLGSESCPALPCCDEYSLYTDYDSLPPCYCGTNEGL